MKSLIDFHVHIDYYKDYRSKIEYYEQNRIYALFVTNLPQIFNESMRLFSNLKYVKIALGYHPRFIKEEPFSKELFNKCISLTKYIGEVGLDYSDEFLDYKEEQQRIFKYICKKAGETNKILSVHSHKAEEDVLKILIDNNVKFAVFHWYSGSISLIKDILDAGYYFSINYSMLRTKKGTEIIKSIPLNRILIETDGPFSNFKGRPISPNDLSQVYNEIGRKIGVNDLSELAFNNLKNLLLSQLNSF